MVSKPRSQKCTNSINSSSSVICTWFLKRDSNSPFLCSWVVKSGPALKLYGFGEKSVLNRSSTSECCHQHISSPAFITNIDVYRCENDKILIEEIHVSQRTTTSMMVTYVEDEMCWWLWDVDDAFEMLTADSRCR